MSMCVCVKASSQEPRHGVPRERVRFGKTEGRRGEDSTQGEARSCAQPSARPKPRRGSATRPEEGRGASMPLWVKGNTYSNKQS